MTLRASRPHASNSLQIPLEMLSRLDLTLGDLAAFSPLKTDRSGLLADRVPAERACGVGMFEERAPAPKGTFREEATRARSIILGGLTRSPFDNPVRVWRGDVGAEGLGEGEWRLCGASQVRAPVSRWKHTCQRETMWTWVQTPGLPHSFCSGRHRRVAVCCSGRPVPPPAVTGPTGPTRPPVQSLRRAIGGAALLAAMSLSPVNAQESVFPDKPPVVDNGNVLTSGEERRLNDELAAFEREKGFKIRVLVQKREGSLVLPKDIWPLDDTYAVVMVDPRAGNILDFRLGRLVIDKLSPRFWTELQNRYGNKFFVRDNGEDRAVLGAVENIRICLQKSDGCQQVPGFSRDQFVVTAIVTAASGVVAGLAPRQGGEKEFDIGWLGIFSPFWGFLLIAFGIGPIVQREGLYSIDLLENLGIFFGVAITTFFASRNFFPPSSEA